MTYITGFNGMGCCSGNGNGGGTATNNVTHPINIDEPILVGTRKPLPHTPTFIYDVQYSNGGLTENVDYRIVGNEFEFLFPDPSPSPSRPYTLQVKYTY